MGLRKDKAELQKEIDILAKGVADLRKDIIALQYPTKKDEDYFNYFVSYAYSGGFGCCDISMTREITSKENIQNITKALEEKLNMKQVTILYWRKFEND